MQIIQILDTCFALSLVSLVISSALACTIGTNPTQPYYIVWTCLSGAAAWLCGSVVILHYVNSYNRRRLLRQKVHNPERQVTRHDAQTERPPQIEHSLSTFYWCSPNFRMSAFKPESSEMPSTPETVLHRPYARRSTSLFPPSSADQRQYQGQITPTPLPRLNTPLLPPPKYSIPQLPPIFLEYKGSVVDFRMASKIGIVSGTAQKVTVPGAKAARRDSVKRIREATARRVQSASAGV